MSTIITNIYRTYRLLKIFAKNSKDSKSENIDKLIDSSVMESFSISKKIDSYFEKLKTCQNRQEEKQKKDMKTFAQRCERNMSRIVALQEKNNELILNSNTKENTELKEYLNSFVSFEKNKIEKIENNIGEINSILATLRDFSAKQSTELNRWKVGYDYKILNSFLGRLISSIDEIDEKVEELKNANLDEKIINEFLFLRDILLANLDGEGLGRVEPEIGEKIDITKTNYIVSATNNTSDEKLDFTISKVIKPAYVLYLTNEVQQIIRKASVEIYKLER